MHPPTTVRSVKRHAAPTRGVFQADGWGTLPIAVALFRATGPAMNIAVAIYVAYWMGVELHAGNLIVFLLFCLLGIWAAGYPGRALVVFVNLVGIYAIFYGFTELFAAFDLRGLGRRLDRERPAV